MRIHMAICAVIMLVVIISLSGCGGTSTTSGVNDWTEARGSTGSSGELTLNFRYGSSWNETLSTYDAFNGSHLGGMQVLGISNFTDAAFFVADPNYGYYPKLTTNASQANNIINMSPVDSNTTRANIDEDTMAGTSLAEFSSLYQLNSYITTVASLQAKMATLSANRYGMFVVCAASPLNFSRINTTSVSYRNTSSAANLQTAIGAINWDSIYSSAGFSGTQNLRVVTLNPYTMDITNTAGNANAGILADSLVAIVLPEDSPSAPAPKSLRVDLGWNKPVDLDLHLVRNTPPVYHDLYDPLNDCFWQPNVLNWGVIGNTSDDPQFVRDSRDGTSTEEIYLGKMTPGDSYAVAIDYWGDPFQNVSHVPVSGVVSIWVNGVSNPITFNSAELTYGAPFDINPTGEFTIVCYVNGTTGAVVENVRGRNIFQRPAFRAGAPLLRKK